MSILMYDSINQQSAVNKAGRERKRRERSMENLHRPQDGGKARTMGFCVPLCYLYLSIFSYFSFLCLYIQSASSKKIIMGLALICCLFFLKWIIGVWEENLQYWSLTFFSFLPLRCILNSHQLPPTPSSLPCLHILISHYSFLPLIFLSFFPPFLSPPCLSPLVYWFSRLRIPRVENCNTQASNYFGVCLFAFPLHLFGLCL